MIDRTTPIPLYFQISEDIRGKIESGELSEGDKLPSEHELCSEFEVSRSVIRQSLQSLSHAGLIVTERGRGAFVRGRRVPIALTQRLDPLQDGVAKAGFNLTTQVLEQKLIDAPEFIADKITDKQAIYLKRLRYADDRILLLVKNYIPYKRAPALLEFEGLDTTSLYVFLEDQCGIVVSTGRRQIEIEKASHEISELLGVETGERVLFNREITFDQEGRAVEYYESWHHPDRTQLTIDLHRTLN